MFKPKCLIQPINEIYSLRKKKNPKLTTCSVRAACLNKTKKNPKFFWIAEWRDRESERERENPKAETEMVKPPAAKCEGHHRSPPDHPSPHRLRLLTAAAAAAAARSRHAPFARPVLLSDLVCFCFVFFSFPLFLFRFCYFTTLDSLAYLFSCFVT